MNATDEFAGQLGSSRMTVSPSIVLVVDDDISVRESLELLIRNEGWRPETCASAKEFLDHPRVPVSGCLILDISLPGLNGLELQTHMLDNGCPLDVIAEILGHDNLDLTAHCVQVSTRLMMAAYNSAHPYALNPQKPKESEALRVVAI
jgi:CheY-like chemotaxis protein